MAEGNDVTYWIKPAVAQGPQPTSLVTVIGVRLAKDGAALSCEHTLSLLSEHLEAIPIASTDGRGYYAPSAYVEARFARSPASIVSITIRGPRGFTIGADCSSVYSLELGFDEGLKDSGGLLIACLVDDIPRTDLFSIFVPASNVTVVHAE
ncbi:MAG: hypothetical protein IMW98_07645 [Firmicutes bacterium]|nr:hypothetical protein [Bacillota bacterium]